MSATWSHLLLRLILERLDLADHARFASVCSSWRSVAINNPPINKPLYFVLSHRPEHLVRRFITSFVPSWKEARFIGAAMDGWLVIVINDRDPFLLNKAFNSMIPLPPLPEYVKDAFTSKAVLSSPPPSSSSSSSSSSSGECTVFIMHFHGGVFYCRPGSDKSFTKLPNIPHWPEDILFYKGQLYVLCSANTIIIFDHLLNTMTQLVAHNCDIYRLFISENRILVRSSSKPHNYELTLEDSKQRMIRVNNIDDKLLLIINPYCSLSITSNEHKEFQRHNCPREKLCGTSMIDMGKEPYVANTGDPWPLFFYMFSLYRIKYEVSNVP